MLIYTCYILYRLKKKFQMQKQRKTQKNELFALLQSLFGIISNQIDIISHLALTLFRMCGIISL